jgi:hypothetical protein
LDGSQILQDSIAFTKTREMLDNVAQLTQSNPPFDMKNLCVTMFSDLTKKVTMQNLMHDGGFSTTGITEDIIEQMEK